MGIEFLSPGTELKCFVAGSAGDVSVLKNQPTSNKTSSE